MLDLEIQPLDRSHKPVAKDILELIRAADETTLMESRNLTILNMQKELVKLR
jgi:hypothetical protein